MGDGVTGAFTVGASAVSPLGAPGRMRTCDTAQGDDAPPPELPLAAPVTAERSTFERAPGPRRARRSPRTGRPGGSSGARRARHRALEPGAMTSSMVCRCAERVRPSLPPASAIRRAATRDRRCPVLAIHGTDDQSVTYQGGLRERALDLPAPDGSGHTLREVGVASRAPAEPAGPADRGGLGSPQRLRCGGPDRRRSSTTWRGSTTVHTGCGGGAPPGRRWMARVAGERPVRRRRVDVCCTTMTISANEQLWASFQDQPLPAR